MFVDCIFLIKSGVPWAKVFGGSSKPLTATQRFAVAVTLGELENGQGNFDWDRMAWRKRSE